MNCGVECLKISKKKKKKTQNKLIFFVTPKFSTQSQGLVLSAINRTITQQWQLVIITKGNIIYSTKKLVVGF